ncbi:MAG: hypothetical protein WA936_09255 [Erythrobacter sp.]|uniref:hypothetical protein n=1 Tax=Erythrobacter sp. TaxID=1042 RepID=UPI003C7867B1
MIPIKAGHPRLWFKVRMIHLRLAVVPFAALALAACQTTQTAQATAPDPPAFVEAACGGCHGVEPPLLSPNPNAPTFASVANRPGVTKATVRAWLVNAHNYPEVMDFDLERDRVEQVTDYMLTLRRDDYRPIP